MIQTWFSSAAKYQASDEGRLSLVSGVLKAEMTLDWKLR
jgi:hypothetical protein